MIPLCCHNLIAEGVKIHSKAGPSIEMVCSRDSAGGAFTSADRPVLSKVGDAVVGGRLGRRC